MKTYICKQPVELSRKDFDKINKLFEVNFNDESPEMEALINELDARPDTTYCTFWWKFEDGSVVQMDIISNENCYWDDVGVIKDREEECFSPGYLLEEEMTFESFDCGCKYVCKIKILEDK